MLRLISECRSIFLLLVVCAIAACGAVTHRPAGASVDGMNFYVSYDFYSDPPGARIYGSLGNDLGETAEGAPVSVLYTYFERFLDSGRGVPRRDRTITLKKRGYPTTIHKFTAVYEWNNADSAWSRPHKMTIVLDSE